MTRERLQRLKGRLRKLWVLSPEKLWLVSIALQRRGHWMLAFWLKQLNGFLYHNSLASEASTGADIFLGHSGLGVAISRNVEIGSGVIIWHNVMLLADRPERRAPPPMGSPAELTPQGSSSTGPPSRVIVEDGVRIGANASVIAPRGKTLRIGRGAFIGAGAIVTKDVPERATIVGPPPQLLLDEDGSGDLGEHARASLPAAEAASQRRDE